MSRPQEPEETKSLRPITYRSAGIIAAFFVTVILQKLLYNFVSTKGVAITGDEPTYIMQAQALSHFSVQILSTITHDLAARIFPNTYPANATLAMVEHYIGPAGVISPFPPGVSAPLVPFVTILGPVTGSVIGIISLNSAGLIWLHQRVSWFIRLGVIAQAVLAIIFAMPAVLLAANQIYPDLPVGIVMAVGLVEIAAIERRGKTSALSLTLIAMSITASPWLQPKNLVPAVIILAAFLFVVFKRQLHLTSASIVAGISIMSFALYLLYNQHYYGHLLGLPEPLPKVSAAGMQYTLGLLFDRHQGLFVQVPYCLLALTGLIAYGRRHMPVATFTTILSFVAILGLNGTYISNPYGGYSLAGRFMWTLIPISLPWVALVLARFEERQKSLKVPLIVVVLVWLYQAEPIFAGQHDYYNALQGPYKLWPSWWEGLTHVLPQFGGNTYYFGTPVWSLPLELIVEALVVGALLYWLRTPLQRNSAGRHPGDNRRDRCPLSPATSSAENLQEST